MTYINFAVNTIGFFQQQFVYKCTCLFGGNRRILAFRKIEVRNIVTFQNISALQFNYHQKKHRAE